MINLHELALKALNEIKINENFPKRGFVAGGCLANLIWEYVSGNKAIINDIDIFICEGVIESIPNSNYIDNKKLAYAKSDVSYYEDYRGLASTSQAKEYYMINDTDTKGIYNFIYYSANSYNPQVIINSFDINCTQIGYSIEENKFYWTPEFEDFLKTGDLKLTNILSPAHSAIRLTKKKFELNANLADLEINMCSFCIANGMSDTNRIAFTDKYADIYRKYESVLNNHFLMIEDTELTKKLQVEKNFIGRLYRLHSLKHRHDMFKSSAIDIQKIWRGQDLLFYIRNIRGDESKSLVWRKVQWLFNNNDYIDGEIDPQDLDVLSRLVQVAPKTIENLKGLSLSKQILIMKTLFDRYKEDPIIAISILEKVKIDNNNFDEGDLLLLELSVRKEIISDTKDKVKRILHPETIESNIENKDSYFFGIL